MMTLEECIERHAGKTPDKVAVVCGRRSITYGELWKGITSRAEELSSGGLLPRRPYVFRNTQDIDFVLTYCAVHYLGAVAVPLESQALEVNFQAVKDEVDAAVFPEGIVDVLYTTGTTGKSKGVMLSGTCLEACADNFINDLGFTPELLFIISGPLNHIASLFKMQ